MLLVEVIGTVVRGLAAWMLVSAGLTKAVHPAGLATAIGGVTRSKTPAVVALGLVETATGVGLFLPSWWTWFAAIGAAQFGLFLIYVRVFVARDANCGCGGLGPSRNTAFHQATLGSVATLLAVQVILTYAINLRPPIGPATTNLLLVAPLVALLIARNFAGLGAVRHNRAILDQRAGLAR